MPGSTQGSEHNCSGAELVLLPEWWLVPLQVSHPSPPIITNKTQETGLGHTYILNPFRQVSLHSKCQPWLFKNFKHQRTIQYNLFKDLQMVQKGHPKNLRSL